MPDRNTPEAQLIRRQEQSARPHQPLPDLAWPASQFHDPTRTPKVRVPRSPSRTSVLTARAATHATPMTPAPPSHPGTLTSQRLKVTTTLDVAELLAVAAPEGKPRTTLRIRLPDRTLTADIAAKSLRKAQTAIRNADKNNIVLVLQGLLAAVRIRA
jgi:hypothetical protein